VIKKQFAPESYSTTSRVCMTGGRDRYDFYSSPEVDFPDGEMVRINTPNRPFAGHKWAPAPIFVSSLKIYRISCVIILTPLNFAIYRI
jgi:hypothetical protein